MLFKCINLTDQTLNGSLLVSKRTELSSISWNSDRKCCWAVKKVWEMGWCYEPSNAHDSFCHKPECIFKGKKNGWVWTNCVVTESKSLWFPGWLEHLKLYPYVMEGKNKSISKTEMHQISVRDDLENIKFINLFISVIAVNLIWPAKPQRFLPPSDSLISYHKRPHFITVTQYTQVPI